MPIGLVRNGDGRAVGLQLARCKVDEKGIPTPQEGTEFEVEADLIVSAIGQGGDLTGLEELGNDKHLIEADAFLPSARPRWTFRCWRYYSPSPADNGHWSGVCGSAEY